jgi:hypothetical protein
MQFAEFAPFWPAGICRISVAVVAIAIYTNTERVAKNRCVLSLIEDNARRNETRLMKQAVPPGMRNVRN